MSEPDSTDLLASQLCYVGRHVPYFRESSCDDGRQLEGFPFTFKPQIRNDYASFISDEFLNVRQPLVEFLTAKDLGVGDTSGGYRWEVSFGNNIVVAETTGTSGTVLRCPKTLADCIRLGIGMWRQRRSFDSLVRPGNLFPLIHRGITPVRNQPWNDEPFNVRAIYEEIRNGGFRWIHCRADFLQRHVAVFRREGWRPSLPNLKVIEAMGHFLHQEVAADLAEFFEVEIVDHYGMLETWTIAMTCRHGALHINEHNVHIEIIDEREHPVRLGETGRIVVTSLQERLMPFVRYLTDDFGMFVEKRCPCGSGTKTLALVEGRSGNLIKGAAEPVFGDLFFMDVFRRVGSFDLRSIHIRQTALSDFIVETNFISEPLALNTQLEEETGMLLGRPVRFQHVVLNDAEVAAQQRQKPWVFRCEC